MLVPIKWLKDYVNTNKSPKEIAESFTALGLMLDKPIANDVMDLEHRMDRSDWLSIIGCARDFAAFEGIELKKPEGAVPTPKGNGNISIKVEAPDLVRRFNTRVFKGVKVAESPDWLKERLTSYGLPTINNIVDITNFVMVELGQPMHAQDLNKFSKQEIVFRRGKAGEKVITLLGQEVEVDEETLVMAERENLIGIGAIVGSKRTSVDNTTTDIILDAGNYNQANIRKTSRRLNIRNETVARTEKFLHPELTQLAIERATKLILDLAGGDYYENEDYYPVQSKTKEMNLRFSRVEKIGGIVIGPTKAKDILTRLEYKVLSENSEGIKLEIPYFRTDIEVEDDIVSDILRINNYKNIPHEVINSAPPQEVTPAILDFEDKLRDLLVNLEGHEHITSPLVKENSDDKTQIVLDNSLNSEQNALRTSIREALKGVSEIYKKNKIDSGLIFEIGKTYFKTGNTYNDLQEIRVLEVYAWNKEGIKAANNNIKQVLSGLLVNLGIKEVSIQNKTIKQGKMELGEIRNDSFTLFTENLLKCEKSQLRVRDQISNITTKDITVEVKPNEKLSSYFAKIQNENKDAIEISQVDEFVKGDSTFVTFRIFIEN